MLFNYRKFWAFKKNVITNYTFKKELFLKSFLIAFFGLFFSSNPLKKKNEFLNLGALQLKNEFWQVKNTFSSNYSGRGSNKNYLPIVKSNRKKQTIINKDSLNLKPSMVAKQGLVMKPGFEKIMYEEIGLFPRSFSRVFDRFVKQLFADVEKLVLQEYRFYRYLFLTTAKCIFILLFLPLLVNLLAKNYIVRPLSNYFWNTKQSPKEIFLNAYQQKHAFTELQDFEEKVYFQSLVLPQDILSETYEQQKNSESYTQTVQPSSPTLQEKTVELAITYNNQSIEAITNFFADLISFLTLCYLLVVMQIQINITKSFLLEVFFGLEDSLKGLLILLTTDLLVGYHSDGPWAIVFESIFDHYGLPENQTGVFFLVATLPVLLDVLFKYLIFRHLNRASPTTVATYHAMIE